MNEVAFKVKPGCRLHEAYFNSMNEKRKLVGFAKEFLDRYHLPGRRYAIAQRLAIDMSDEECKPFANQLLVNRDKNNCVVFMKKSPLNILWGKEVCAKVDFDIIDNPELLDWHWDFVTSGKHALWDYKGELYGYLSNNYDGEIKLADYMEPMKMSEYYKVIEEWEENHGSAD